MDLRRLTFGFIYLLFSYHLAGNLLAQNFVNHKIEQRDGLSQNSVYSILEDENGFMWAATQVGIDRFSSSNEDFKHYSYDLLNINHLNEEVVLKEDTNSHKIWIGAKGGLAWIDTRNYTPHPLKSETWQKLNVSALDFQVNAIQIINDDTLLLGTNKGLCEFIIKENRVLEVFPADSTRSINSILPIDKPQFLLGSNSGLYLYNHSEKSISSIGENKEKVLCLEKDVFKNSNRIFVSIENEGVFKINLNTSELIPLPFSNKKVRTIFQPNRDEVWFGDESGITTFNLESNKKDNLKNEDGNEINAQIRVIYQNSPNNVIWIGTRGSGVLMICRKKQSFTKHFSLDLSSTPLSPNKFIWAFYLLKNESIIYLGTEEGLVEFDYSRDTSLNTFKTPINGGQAVHCLIKKPGKNEIFVGTSKGLFTFDLLEKRFNEIDIQWPNSNNEPFSVTSLLFFQEKNLLLIGTGTDGLWGVNLSKSLIPKRFSSIPNGRIGNLNKGLNDELLIGSEDGLWIAKESNISWEDGKLGNPIQELKNKEIISTSLTTDSLGYWVGTRGSGIYKLKRKNERFELIESYIPQNGLNDETVYGILSDQNGNFWLPTNQGLALFFPNKKAFITYLIEDGLQYTEFNSGAHLKHKDTLFLGGVNGFNIFVPQKIKPEENNHFKISLTIDTIKDDKTTGERNFYPNQKDTLILKDSYTLFKLRIRVFDYHDPGKFFSRLYFLNSNKEKLDSLILKDSQSTLIYPNNCFKSDSWITQKYWIDVSTINSRGKETRLSLPVHVKPPSYSIAQKDVPQVYIDTPFLVLLVLSFVFSALFEAQRQTQKKFNLLRDIGTELSEATSLGEFRQIIQNKIGFKKLKKVLNSDVMWIGKYNPSGKCIDIIANFEIGCEVSSGISFGLNEKNRPAIWCFDTEKEIFTNNIEEEFRRRKVPHSPPKHGKQVGSLIYQPLLLGKKDSTHKIGVISIQNFKKNAYKPNFFRWFIGKMSNTKPKIVERELLSVLNNYVSNVIVRVEKTIEKELADSRLKLYKRSIISHFIFRSVDLIREFVEGHISSEFSKNTFEDYIDNLSSLVRNQMEIIEPLNTVMQEVEFLKSYSYVRETELASKGKDFSMEIHYNPEREQNEIESRFIPTMLIQPFLENAIVHGFGEKKELVVNITFEKVQNGEQLFLGITIEDNGIGMIQGKNTKKAKETRKKVSRYKELREKIEPKGPHAIQITKERIKMLNELYHTNEKKLFVLEDTDLSKITPSRKGTRIFVRIPWQLS